MIGISSMSRATLVSDVRFSWWIMRIGCRGSGDA